MAEQLLDVYGVRVALSGCEEAVSGVSAHFAGFLAGPGDRAAASVTVKLVCEPPRLAPSARLVADHFCERGVVYNEGPVTWVDHQGSALSRFDHARDCGLVTAEAIEDLVELGYLMVHSRLGMLLERRGLVRVHALGLVRDGRAALVLAPPGGGKSALALALLRRTRALLLSDDVVLLDAHGLAYPFPHPIGVSNPEVAEGIGPVRPFCRRHHSPKWIIELGALLPRHATGPAPVSMVARLVRVTSPPSRLVRAGRLEALSALWRDAVIGLGLPQVVELVLRHGARDLWRQTPRAMRRAQTVARIWATARSATLEVFDPNEAARALFDALGR